jgi:dienelactone hydrolase
MGFRFHKDVSIPVGKSTLQGELAIPEKAKAVVIFSHGSGSSRFSRRNQAVAKFLQQRGMGTLLFDLLTEEEDLYYSNRFDIDLITKRLAGATAWLEIHPAAEGCRIGYFGASTGAAAALKAAAKLPGINAVVSRGGRPDLAMDDLPRVKTPVLLIVGSLDTEVLQLNREAYMRLAGEKKLEVVEGATHLFEERGKMEIVSMLASNWFEKYLIPQTTLK